MLRVCIQNGTDHTYVFHSGGMVFTLTNKCGRTLHVIKRGFAFATCNRVLSFTALNRCCCCCRCMNGPLGILLFLLSFVYWPLYVFCFVIVVITYINNLLFFVCGVGASNKFIVVVYWFITALAGSLSLDAVRNGAVLFTIHLSLKWRVQLGPIRKLESNFALRRIAARVTRLVGIH